MKRTAIKLRQEKPGQQASGQLGSGPKATEVERPKGFVRRLLGALLALLLLSACRLGEPPALAHARDFSLVIPVYNDAGLAHARSTLRPHLGRADSFMVVSGNFEGDADTAWLNRAGAALRETYPGARLFAATSGLRNVERVAADLSRTFEAIVYVYEPNFPNQPEFTWDFGATLAQFDAAKAKVRAAGFRTIGKPTGRPVLQSSLQRYGWDYGRLATTVDELFIQTQTYCRESARTFSRALDTVLEQYGPLNGTLRWVPQVTVDPEAPNGTTVAQARACIRAAQARGLPGATLWWSPAYAARAVDFIARLNADAAADANAAAADPSLEARR